MATKNKKAGGAGRTTGKGKLAARRSAKPKAKARG